MIYCIADQVKKRRLDAKIEINGSDLLLHSRGGSTGGRPARNVDYEKALRIIVKELRVGGRSIEAVFLDSTLARAKPEHERLLLEGPDLLGISDEDAVSLIRQRSKKWGQKTGASGGNSTKALRIRSSVANELSLRSVLMLQDWHLFVGAPVRSPSVLGQIASKATPDEIDAVAKTLPPNDADIAALEGDLQLVTHLRRERVRGLAKKKKSAFILEHGFLYCERCKIDPIALYGPHGHACIEVHHAAVHVKDMPVGHETRLEDLQCLCANCHRIVHREIPLQA